jgi:hypothetical protein
MCKGLLLSLALLSAAPLAHAQKAKNYRQFNNIEFELTPGQDRVPAYLDLADTTSKPAYQAARDRTVAVVGEYSTRWAVIDHNDYKYFVRQKDLAGLAPGRTVKQVADARNNAPTLDANTHRITYTGVVQVPGNTQAELLTRARVWATGITTEGKPPVFTTEQGTDIVVVSGREMLNYNYFSALNVIPVRYTATLSLREGRYQYRIDNFQLEYPGQKLVAAESPELPLLNGSGDGRGTVKYTAALRGGFDDAVRQVQAKLQAILAKPLTNAAGW